MDIVKLPIGLLEPNTGQISGLPANPRKWSQSEIEKLSQSLIETPELFEARPIIVYPNAEGKYVILGGNLRYAASLFHKAQEVPCLIIPENWSIHKLGEIVLKDNGIFGSWDYASLLEDYDDIDFEGLGIHVFQPDDYSEKNSELDPSAFDDSITLHLKYEKNLAQQVNLILGDDPKQTLLTALNYEDATN